MEKTVTEPVVYEQHMHTPLCRHAEGEPEEYARVALRRNLAGIVVTCHNAMPPDYGHDGRMAVDQVELYAAMVERCRERFAGELDVRLGLECDFFPGYERHVERQLAAGGHHHVLGSVHPQLPIWRTRHLKDGARHAWSVYFDHLARAAETGLFDTISHPDLIKNNTAADWSPQRAMDEILRCLDRIAETGVAMELNTSGVLKTIPEMNPNPPMLRQMRERGIPVVVGADAHEPQRTADRFERAYDLLEEAGYTHVSQFLDRQRRDVPIAEARASLTPIHTTADVK